MSETEFVTLKVNDYYEINRMGQVRRKGSKVLKKASEAEYPTVNLFKDGNETTIAVHRLVALQFVSNPNPDKFNLVNHKDGNKGNYLPENLEWTDKSGNGLHAHATGLNRGRKSGKVLQIEFKTGNVIKEYESAHEAAKAMNCNPNSVRHACSGQTETLMGFVWKYVVENDFKDEKWKNIPKTFKLRAYEVSSCGRFRMKHNKRILSPCKQQGGYLQIYLTALDGTHPSFPAHRMVAEVFCKGKSDEKWQVNHINSVRDDNRKENLEWVSHSENMQHASKKLLQQSSLDGIILRLWRSTTMAAEAFNIPREHLKDAARRDHTVSGFKWKFIDKTEDNYKECINRDNLHEHVEWIKSVVQQQTKRVVHQIGADGFVIKVWKSAPEAAKALGTTMSRIKDAVRHNHSTSGFKWKFVQVPTDAAIAAGAKRKIELDAPNVPSKKPKSNEPAKESTTTLSLQSTQTDANNK